ncbi:glutamine synthetase [Powellomyces hirtus]|uniref:Glutamine synthetase n=1 Tax=Powellomyces hirtus TaxID=109895 RepID=A0A507ECQ1_9FUNG|nr:hypothetical protein DFJ77DRAFT_463698 [Powellomyces hirtus]TPX61843.1 glutamine synthetase [Powellomyces hirtus]
MPEVKKPQALSFKELEEILKDDFRVRVSGCDIDGIPRGKTITKAKFLKSLEEGFGFCNVAFGWDMLDKTYDESVGVERGYSDLIAKLDTSTLRRIPWDHQTPHFLFDFMDPVSRQAFANCPRGLLKRAIAQCNELGFEPLCGMEFEFFNFKETPDTLATKNGVNLTPLTQGMFGYSLLRPSMNQDFFNQIYDQCREYGIPIEGFHTETGPGVFEAALEYAPALQMADRAHLFKTAAKQIGLRHGVIASFMAKPWNDLPGTSGHIHFSLANLTTGKNAFVPENDEEELGSVMRSFVAGLLEALPSIMPLLAPTINSYKRLVENYWAPVTVSYGIENRTSAIRIITPPTCPKSATRLELRVPGADVNPYLAIGACLAAGIHGVKKKLVPKFPPMTGNDPAGAERLPRTLKEATDKMMAKGSVAREILGDAFVEHFGKTRLHEWKQWETAVTNWEVKRYMETV